MVLTSKDHATQRLVITALCTKRYLNKKKGATRTGKELEDGERRRIKQSFMEDLEDDPSEVLKDEMNASG